MVQQRVSLLPKTHVMSDEHVIFCLIPARTELLTLVLYLHLSVHGKLLYCLQSVTGDVKTTVHVQCSRERQDTKSK